MSKITRMRARIVCALVVVLAVVGCTGGGDEPPQTSETFVPAVSAWAECPQTFDEAEYGCGWLDVPIRYGDLSAGTVPVAFAVRQAGSPNPDEHLGWLFVNPGGPGVSAAQMVLNASLYLGSELTDRFNIAAVDPRGAGESYPKFSCGDTTEFMALFDQVARDADRDAAEAAVTMCVDNSGQGIDSLGAEYAARDIDSLRRALEIDEISFLGSSYGGVIGVWHAALFADHVRAMVLDAPPVPLLAETAEGRMSRRLDTFASLEERLADALDACAVSDCPFDHGGDPHGWFREHAHRLTEVAERVGGNGIAPMLSVVTPLYAEELWPVWHEGLRALVEDDDPRVMSGFASMLLTISTEQPTPWTLTAHVNCLDDWAAYPDLRTEARISEAEALQARADAEFPLLGSVPNLGWTYDLCAFYPPIIVAPASPQHGFEAKGVPVLIIGNSADPVTPLARAEEVAGMLDDAWLIEVEQPQHGAYPTSACAAEAVDRFLISLSTPAERHSMCGAE